MSLDHQNWSPDPAASRTMFAHNLAQEWRHVTVRQTRGHTLFRKDFVNVQLDSETGLVHWDWV